MHGSVVSSDCTANLKTSTTRRLHDATSNRIGPTCEARNRTSKHTTNPAPLDKSLASLQLSIMFAIHTRSRSDTPLAAEPQPYCSKRNTRQKPKTSSSVAHCERAILAFTKPWRRTQRAVISFDHDRHCNPPIARPRIHQAEAFYMKARGLKVTV